MRRFIDAANYLPMVLIIAIAGTLLTRGYRLYQQAEAARADLAVQVAQKELEIRQSYANLHEQEKLNAINTERQRLIRDMHDGIGGQLVSLMLQLKSHDLPREQVHQQVQGAIDDLRLVIDSMDSVGDSLDIALAIFRERMQPRLKAAGVALEWQNHLEGSVQGFRPQEILHIYRILQEGMTNTLKYAEATHVTLSLWPEGEKIRIDLSDNGKGFDMAAKLQGRRGLNHMQKRAHLLGADLRINSAPNEGTHLSFVIFRPKET
ncbi:MAG: ATP-binding protein [Asticcacaulis sp.]